jgi:hypothetical protein
MSKVIGRSARKARSLRQLPANPQCIVCGYQHHEALTRVRGRFFHRHHLAYLAPDDRAWVVVCLNCHAELTARQGDTGVFPSERVASPETERCFVAAMFDLFALAAERAFGPDAPRTRRLALMADLADEVFVGTDASAEDGPLREAQRLQRLIADDVEAVPQLLAAVDFTAGRRAVVGAGRILAAASAVLARAVGTLTSSPHVDEARIRLDAIGSNCDRLLTLVLEATHVQLLAATLADTSSASIHPAGSQ